MLAARGDQATALVILASIVIPLVVLAGRGRRPFSPDSDSGVEDLDSIAIEPSYQRSTVDNKMCAHDLKLVEGTAFHPARRPVRAHCETDEHPIVTARVALLGQEQHQI